MDKLFKFCVHPTCVLLLVLFLVQSNIYSARAFPQGGIPAAAEAADYYSEENQEETQPKPVAAQPVAVEESRPEEQRPEYNYNREQPQVYYREPGEQRYDYRPAALTRWGR